MRRYAALALRGIVLALALNGAAFATVAPVALSGRAMGTTWSVKFVQPEAALEPAEISREIKARLEQLEQMFSTYRADSDLTHFNAATDSDWIAVTPEMVQIARESRRISALTNGAFDVTVFPLVQLWGFGARRRVDVPAEVEIARSRRWVDWRALEVREMPPALRKGWPELRVDFSSMAKGFAVDAISDWLNRSGVRAHLVQVGGDVKATGSPTDDDGWRVAIEQPLEEGRAIERVLRLQDQALSTSGNNRNAFRVNGRRYGHILDPRKGWPPTHDLASVSVVHVSCATSSALATALFVVGPEAGLRLARENDWAGLFLVGESGTFRPIATPAFDRVRTDEGERVPGRATIR